MMLNAPEPLTIRSMRIEERLIEKATATLLANRVMTQYGSLLTAGGTHFKTAWVRDFCFAVPGALAAGEAELVKRQLLAIYSFKNREGYLPRGLDVVNPKLRVTWNVLSRNTPRFMEYENKKLKPEFNGEHGTPAYDSNLLFIIAHDEYRKKTGEPLLSQENLNALLKVYEFDSRGLLNQPAFSDWQDSAERKGAVLLTHLLYLKAAQILGLDKEVDRLCELLPSEFGQNKSGLFRERPRSEQAALDSHIFLLSHKLPLAGVNLSKTYEQLKRSEMWCHAGIPGLPVSPQYASREISWTVKAIGMRHYHDDLVWGWLVADAVKCARIHNDTVEADRITEAFYQATANDEFLAEVYSYRDGGLRMYQGLIYRSEAPFSWTAAKWIEAFK